MKRTKPKKSRITPKGRANLNKARRRMRRNPGFTNADALSAMRDHLENITETMAGMALIELIRRAGFRPSSILAAVQRAAGTTGTTGTRPPAPAPTPGCVCGGKCLCHSGIQIAAVPCPPDCPNAGSRFDGCHRCDCPPDSKGGSK